MKKSILFVGTLLMLSSGCVTETTYAGKDSVNATGPDTHAAAKIRLNLGMGYLEKGDMTQAKFNLDKAQSFDPSNPDIYLAKAYYYQKVGDEKSADAAYQSLISLNDSNPDAHNNYGVFLCAQKRYADAEQHFLKALEQPNYIRMDDTYENAAVCAIQAGNKTKAASYFDQALGYSPNSGKLLLEAAELALGQNNTGKAAGYLQRYRQVGKESPQSLWLELELAQQQGELARLHKYGNELVQKYPKSEQAKRYLTNDY